MKNTMKVLLALPLILSLAGCGSSEPAETEEVKEETAAETEEQTPAEPEETVKEETPAEEEKEKLTPMVVVDNDKMKVTVTDVDVENTLTISLEYVNKTDTPLEVIFPHVSTDGLEDIDMMSVWVDPKQSAKDTLHFDYWQVLKDKGMKFTDFELQLVAADPNMTSAVDETFHIYPYGEDKAETFEISDDMLDAVLVDNDLYRIAVIGDALDAGNDRYTFYTFIENRTDKGLSYHFEQGSINGFAGNIYSYSTYLSPGAKGVAAVNIEGALRANNIQKVDEVSCYFIAIDMGAMASIGTDTLTYNPQ